MTKAPLEVLIEHFMDQQTGGDGNHTMTIRAPRQIATEQADAVIDALLAAGLVIKPAEGFSAIKIYDARARVQSRLRGG